MTGSQNNKTPKKENVQESSAVTNDKEELNSILDRIAETPGSQETVSRPREESEEIVKKPEGSKDQPEDIEGMLNKLTEKADEQPGGLKGFFQRLLSWFK